MGLLVLYHASEDQLPYRRQMSRLNIDALSVGDRRPGMPVGTRMGGVMFHGEC